MHRHDGSGHGGSGRDHERSAGHHEHGAGEASDRRILGTVALNVLLTVAQLVGGALSGSMALVADALHNLNDAMALVVVYVARRVGRRSADRRRTFGYQRAKVVGATVNLVALAVVALFLAYESIVRFFEPRTVDGWTMILLAGVALAIDLATVFLLSSMRRGSTNVRAAFVHNLGDALASVAVLIGGVGILLRGWTWLDPLLSLMIVGYVGWQVASMLPATLRVLMESAPEGFDPERVVERIRDVEGVLDAHHLHVWLLDERRCAAEAHVVVETDGMERMEAIKRQVRRLLREEFDIHHATLELESPAEATEAGHDTGTVPADAADAVADHDAG